MEEVVIGSADASLTLSKLSADGGWRAYLATLRSEGLRAQQTVDDHIGWEEPRDDRTGTVGLAELVRATAEEYKGWDGKKRWEALGQKLAIEVTSDRTGHATFEIRLRGTAINTKGWEAKLAVTLDVMERERLAKQLESFFAIDAA